MSKSSEVIYQYRRSPVLRLGISLLYLLILTTFACGPQEETHLKTFKILTFGDSITAGVRPGVKPDQTYTYYLGELFKKNGIRVEMIKEGISGETTAGALARIETDVIQRSPRYVIIMYGTNDAFIDVWQDPKDTAPRLPIEQYQENLRRIIRLLKANDMTPVLMTPIPMGKSHYFQTGVYKEKGINFKLKEYVDVVREVAIEEHVLLVDQFARWNHWKEMGKDIDKWLPDGVHPNPDGNRFIAETIFRVMKKKMNAYHLKSKD